MFKSLIFACIFLSFTFTAFAAPAKLSVHHQDFLQDPKRLDKQSEVLEDFKTYFYTQTLDHFNYNPQSYTTFKQRYLINTKYWGGANSSAPILAYLGEEAPIDYDLFGGFVQDNAPSFKALIIYIEHRFHGESIPYGKPLEEVMKNASIRGYFNSAQAIADYAEVLLYTKKRLSALDSPIIVVGGSYGGMLASWFRLKYPHIAIGALASSAPILYFDNIIPSHKGYYSVVSKDFKETSTSCYNTIKSSWSEIDKVAAMPNGLSILSKKFNTCRKLKKSSDLKEALENIYTGAAQYNSQLGWMSRICGGIDGAPKVSDTLSKIYAGLVANSGNVSCFNFGGDHSFSEIEAGWKWQQCSEMVMPIGVGKDDNSMFQASPFDINKFTKDCEKQYGVSPRPHWITTYYGGHDIKLVLQKFASNIIFSNGLVDPYSSGGVLEDISDSVLAIYTKQGSHCLDIVPASVDDPEWLVMQREREIEVIQGWLKEYYLNLYALKGY